MLDATGASVLHLRCGFFFTNLLLDPAALDDGVLRITMPVDHLSYAQAAAIISRATGRPLRAEQILDDQMRAALRAAGHGDARSKRP